MRLGTHIRTATLLAWIATCGLAHGQGFVFGPIDGKTPSAPLASAETRNPKVEIAQRLLARLGIYRGEANGLSNQQTTDAVRNFATQHGLGNSPMVNDALLLAIRRVIWQSQNWASGGYKGRDKLVDAAGLKEAQVLLGKLGFETGPIDATFGPQTQVATESFQASQKVTVDGLITPTVLMNLRRAVGGAGNKASGVVRILNWPDYIDPEVLLGFEKENNIQVVYDLFSSNDDLQAKLSGGGQPYDVVFPTANTVSSMASNGLLAPMDKASLKNLKNIDPRVDAAMLTWDKEAKYSVPSMWYTIGIAWNSKLVAKVPGAKSMGSLGNIFDPEQARKFKSCGVAFEDSASDIFPIAAIAAGQRKWEGASTIAAVEKLLNRLVGIVKVVPTDQFVDELATGKLCLAIGYSGDAVQAQSKSHGLIEYKIPLEGGLLAVDTMAIPSNSENKKLAHVFIDYLLRPEVIARVSNVVGYANANINASNFMSASVKSNPAVIPSNEDLSRALPIPILSSKEREDIARIWAKFANAKPDSAVLDLR